MEEASCPHMTTLVFTYSVMLMKELKYHDRNDEVLSCYKFNTVPIATSTTYLNNNYEICLIDRNISNVGELGQTFSTGVYNINMGK
jgi:hypothetical protein